MKAVKPKKNLGQHFLTDLNIANASSVHTVPGIWGSWLLPPSPIRWMPAQIYLFSKSDQVWAFLPNIS